MNPLAERIEQTNRLVLVAVLGNAPDKIATLEDTQDILSLWQAVADEANKHVKLWEKDLEERRNKQDQYFPITFMNHALSDTTQHAVLSFENGYELSIGCGGFFYSSGGEPNHPDTTYEVAILYKGVIVYDTHINIDGEKYHTNDVLGHLSQDQVVQVINQVKNYAPRIV